MPLIADKVEVLLAQFCEDMGTKLDMDAPSHKRAVDNFRKNWKDADFARFLESCERAGFRVRQKKGK